MLENIALLVSVSINASAVVIGVMMENGRRKLDRKKKHLEERRTIYAKFMDKIVRWQLLVVREYELRYETDQTSIENHNAAALDLRLAHREAMEPLFELRMLGSEEARKLSEEIIKFNYAYEKSFKMPVVDRSDPDPDWIRIRDQFIAVARREFEADSN